MKRSNKVTGAQLKSPSLKVRSAMDHLPAAERVRARELLEAWLDREDVTAYEDRDPCLRSVADSQHQCPARGWGLKESDCVGFEPFPVLDHPEWWQDTQGKFILTAHPYFLTGLAALFAWGAANGVTVEVFHPRSSWYYPGHTQLIVLKGG
jgi:hypothetical protein